ncbi:hypothetical protein [Cellulomonas sp. Y8]|uniref:hypothetical protein n=1 Tax=Cellulomonas sp. Y8 TaxID=2591145 RepID=UPI0011CA739B|nr:hypothetical protein [Cellulomonas sp. Y8]
MPDDPSILTVTELTTGMRRAARGDLRREAAVELLIRHWRWLTRPDFLATCMRLTGPDGDLVDVDWALVASYADLSDAQPAQRAITAIAAQLAGHSAPGTLPAGPGNMPALGWLLASLDRADVALVLAGISHAAGTHLHVDRVGEPTPDGRWIPTATSPRLLLDALHAWPEPAVPLEEPE